MPVVNTNVESLQAMQALRGTQRLMEKSMVALSTGQRINSAADDAAGMAISHKLTSQIRGLNQAVRNANDAISMLQTADGASGSISDMLVRMRELSVQSANGTYSSADQSAINAEFVDLRDELGRVISNTTWNGNHILNSSGSVVFQVGHTSADGLTVQFDNLSALSEISAVMAFSAASASGVLSGIDDAIRVIDHQRASWGAVISRLGHAADNALNIALNTSASRSRIQDTDYAQTTAELARAQILQQAGTAMLSQANQRPAYVLALLR
ncbi:MAG: Flagellin [Pseudomonadota bacterium]|jgi:flagellin